MNLFRQELPLLIWGIRMQGAPGSGHKEAIW